MLANKITGRFLQIADSDKAQHLSRFFKTGEGEYGYGDKFLGICVPQTRRLVKEFKTEADVECCIKLIHSEWHEIRLGGFLLLIELYRKAKKSKDVSTTEKIVNIYLEHIDYGNNWDLVDLVCAHILGDWLIDHPQQRTVLDELSEPGRSLWHQRVAIVTTLALIRAGQFADTIRLSKKLLSHKHDLIHKATGWMLREMGKRGGYDELISFLDSYATIMPRTALRYSIERLPENLRQYYLRK